METEDFHRGDDDGDDPHEGNCSEYYKVNKDNEIYIQEDDDSKADYEDNTNEDGLQ